MIKSGDKFKFNGEDFVVVWQSDVNVLCCKTIERSNVINYFDELCKERFISEIKKLRLNLDNISNFKIIELCLIKECIRKSKLSNI